MEDSLVLLFIRREQVTGETQLKQSNIFTYYKLKDDQGENGGNTGAVVLTQYRQYLRLGRRESCSGRGQRCL